MLLDVGHCRPDQIHTLRRLIQDVDLAPGPGGSRITPLSPRQVTAVLEVLYTLVWVTTIAQIQVIALYPSSQLVAHTDPPLPGARFHLPLVTNTGCWSFSGDRWTQLDVGTLYAMDPTVLHGAVDWGAETRIHLMLDLA